MKKTILMALIALMSAASHADTTSDSSTRFSTLFMLKEIVNQTAESTQEALVSNQASAEYYAGLHFYQLAEKIRVGRENCGEVKSVSIANALMFSVLIESTSESLKQIPEINNDEAVSELSKIIEYLHEMKTADDQCNNPTQSLGHVKKANQLISEVNTYLEKIKNELP